MKRVARRISNVASLLLVTTLLCFSVLRLLPGDPVTAILGPAATDPAKVAELRRHLGLDRPFPLQYLRWAGGFVRGDFGRTYVIGGGEQVRTSIARSYGVTLELAAFAIAIALCVALVFGVVGAYRAGRPVDRAISVANYAAQSAPGFVVGPLLILTFALQRSWFPVGQFTPLHAGAGAHLASLVLPSATLAAGLVPSLARVLRTDMSSTLREDFITMAKAKGLSDRYILLRHALRPSTLTMITIAGVNLGTLLSGAVVVERLFNLPGLGTLMINGINQRDYLLVLGVVTIVTVAVLLIAMFIDLLYGVVDPRIRKR